MGCCGQGRAALRARRSSRSTGGTRPPTPAATSLPASGTVSLECTTGTWLRVRGPTTGATYAFTASEAVQAVSAADAAAFLRSGLFRIAG